MKQYLNNVDNEIRRQQEIDFAEKHKNDSDEQLLSYLVECSKTLNKIPTKQDVIGYSYLKTRFGAWNRILERAEIKEKSHKQMEKELKITNPQMIRKNISDHQKAIQKMVTKKLKRELEKPERKQAELNFADKNKDKTDDELVVMIANQKVKLGKNFSAINTIGYTYLIKRFESWEKLMKQVNNYIRS